MRAVVVQQDTMLDGKSHDDDDCRLCVAGDAEWFGEDGAALGETPGTSAGMRLLGLEAAEACRGGKQCVCQLE